MTNESTPNLDLDDRGHVDVGRVAERQLVGCRRFRARWKHPQDLQFAPKVGENFARLVLN